MMNLQQFFQDSTGFYSSSRLINIAVCFAAIIICFWLTYFNLMSGEYFALLLAYGGGVQSWNKYVEHKNPGTNSVQLITGNTTEQLGLNDSRHEG